MNQGKINERFLQEYLDLTTRTQIVECIAAHYDISYSQAWKEVTDEEDSFPVYEYVIGRLKHITYYLYNEFLKG